MKTLFQYIKIILIMGLLIGCSSKEISITKFKINIDLELDSIKTPSILLEENKLLVSSEYLISMCIKSDTIFRVFKRPGLKYLGAFGNMGRGPEEFLNPIISSTNIYREYISISDLRSLKLVKIYDNSHHIDSLKFKRIIPLPGILAPLNYSFLINDSIIYGMILTNKEKELTCYNTTTKALRNLIDFPTLYPELPKSSFPTLFLKQVDISPDRTKLAFSYLQTPIIRIFTINGELIKEIRISEAPAQKEFSVVNNQLVNKDRYFYYHRLAVTNEYIFAFYELRQMTEKSFISLSKKQIHVFNWQGDPIAKFILKDWISIFGVSPDNSCIYFINPDKENFIYKASLDGILN